MEAEFGYRSEIDNGGISGTASKVDGRGTAVGDGRDGDGAKLECSLADAERPVFTDAAVKRRPENAPDKTGSADRIERDAGERRKIRETGWEPERGVFFQLQNPDREYEERPDRDPERYEETAFGYGTGSAEEDHHLRVDLGCGGDLLRGAVRLGRAVEQMTDDAPKRDGTTTSLHIDSKRRKKLKQKKTALGHAEDDHVDWTMEQHL